ncbi:MAG: cobalt-precorrin-5B (C(1))-methyltransferase CbiD [Porphyromonadaceae bacterium]|nr:cobalt-precorrin-5B (C(1))-methyltransferase CbiD [Porphyromonadaceae bacterium]
MILVYGGTTEGRAVCSVLDESGRDYYYSTKGDAQQIDLVHGIRLTGAMDEEAIKAFIESHDIHLVIDAAHPFAAELHRTIGRATQTLGTPVVRYERRYPSLDPRIIPCESYEEMTQRLLAQPAHRLLALTGVNTIPHLKTFWAERETFFRILDRDDSREKAEDAGFPASHIRYFAEGEDQKLFDEIQPDAVVTKESGESGFFDEKIAPALAAGIPIYMITRPDLPEHYQMVNGPVGLRKAVERIVPEFFPLKTGFTTGTTATAATVAALRGLLYGEQTEIAEVTLPSGETVSLPIQSVSPTATGYLAKAIKHSGDDPDVTNGTEIWSEVSLSSEHSEVRFLQGIGVGTVTLPGIGIEVGEPAINATPRRMMTSEVRKLIPEGGVDIRISIPQGEELAKKTFNPRLGIIGGISVIGTSGVVKPFSSEAFIASIARQTNVALALGADTIVINSGAKSENYLKAAFPLLPAQSFVQYGNFIGETLSKLAEHGVPHIYMGIMLGKAVKLAEGNLDTHSKKVVMNRDFLHQAATSSACSAQAHELIDRITLARELWTELEQTDLDRLMRYITDACYKASKTLVPDSVLSVLLIDDEGQIRYSYPAEFIESLARRED